MSLEVTVKPTATASATATIEPRGARAKVPRDHLITITLSLSKMDAQHTDKVFVAEVVNKVLAGFPIQDSGDRRNVGEISVVAKKATVVVSVEGSLVWHGRPDDAAIARMRATLVGEGYYVTIREMRECSQRGCLTDIMVDWDRPTAIPPRWYSDAICGKHDYKTCTKCKSIYSMSSTNSPEKAPSVHCEVCGTVLVEWGGSKIWTAERVVA